MNSITKENTQLGFQLKANSLTFTVINLTSVSLEVIDSQLKDMTKTTPNFFDATPVVIDLMAIEKLQMPLDLSGLVETLKKYRMIPIGVKSTNEAYLTTTRAIGMAVINYSTAAQKQKEPDQLVEAPTPQTSAEMKTMVIDQPVRSGKQVYAKGCDLIINASVSNGAEVLADGNIHIYGTLHGRALAGVQGNTSARIYCKSLDAELVAISGNYLVNEQIPEQYKCLNHLVEIQLVDKALKFNKI